MIGNTNKVVGMQTVHFFQSYEATGTIATPGASVFLQHRTVTRQLAIDSYVFAACRGGPLVGGIVNLSHIYRQRIDVLLRHNRHAHW